VRGIAIKLLTDAVENFGIPRKQLLLRTTTC